MPRSIFPRPTSIRQTMQTQGSARTAIEVRSDNELRAAIARVAANNGATLGTSPGGMEIVICAPFTVRSTIDIPAECQGLTIRAAGAFSIGLSDENIDPIIRISGSHITLDGLLVNNVDQVGAAGGEFIRIAGSGAIENIQIRRCTAYADIFYSDSTPTIATSGIRIVENHCASVTGGGIALIRYLGDVATIFGNKFSGTAGLAANVTGGRAMFIANDLGGAGITTSFGAGNNVIAGNVNTGALTTAGSDQVGLNT